MTVFVVVMGVVLVVGFGAVVAVIAGRMSRGPAPAANVTAEKSYMRSLDIPKGARIEAMTTTSDRLILDLLLPDGEHRLVIVELSSGTRVGTIELHPAP